MKYLRTRTLFSLLLIFSIIACNNNKKVSRPNNGGTVPFDGKTVIDVTYGSNKDYKGVNQDLKLDVYIPPITQGNQKFPLMVYIHGGGFIGIPRRRRRLRLLCPPHGRRDGPALGPFRRRAGRASPRPPS